jgi:hypothetical protein
VFDNRINRVFNVFDRLLINKFRRTPMRRKIVSPAAILIILAAGGVGIAFARGLPSEKPRHWRRRHLCRSWPEWSISTTCRFI